jgi:hypothetical protein
MTTRTRRNLTPSRPSSADKWMQRWRREGCVTASSVRGHRREILEARAEPKWEIGLGSMRGSMKPWHAPSPRGRIGWGPS